jgi:hypothetical protein
VGDGAGEDLREADQPLLELVGVFADVAAARVDAVVEDLGEAAGVGDAVGELTLERDILEVGGDFAKDEGDVDAGEGDLDDDRARGEVVEGQARPLAHGLAADELKHLGRRRRLQVPYAEHCSSLP